MKIIWTTRKSRNRFADILDYIEKDFGESARQHFRTKTKEFTILLKEFPQMGALEIRDKNLRGFQLTKQTNKNILQSKGLQNNHPDTIRLKTGSK